MKHKHALVFDGLANNEPLKAFEIAPKYNAAEGNWRMLMPKDLVALWLTPNTVETRKKPKRISLNGRSFEAPISEPPPHNTRYWIAYPNGIYETVWTNDRGDRHALMSGMCHLTKGAAIEQARVMCAALGGIYTED